MSKFVRDGLLIFGLVFVSRDFEIGTNVSCEESTVSPRTGLIFHFYFSETVSYEFRSLKRKQEVLLPQRDRATRYVS